MVFLIKSIEELNGIEIENGGIIPFSFYENDFYFLFGRYGKDIKGNSQIWGELGGKINKEKNNNFDGTIRKFWENVNGIIGTREGLKNYVTNNFSNLLIVYDDEYKGVIIFLPVEYDKKLEKIFIGATQMNKYILDKKGEIMKAKKRNLLERDQVKWFKLGELIENKNKFKKSNEEIINFINNKFSC